MTEDYAEFLASLDDDPEYVPIRMVGTMVALLIKIHFETLSRKHDPGQDVPTLLFELGISRESLEKYFPQACVVFKEIVQADVLPGCTSADIDDYVQSVNRPN